MCLHCLRLSALNCAEMISVVLFFFHSIEWIEFKLSRRAAICIKSQPNFHRFTIIIAFNIISKYGNIDVSKSMLDRFHKTVFFHCWIGCRSKSTFFVCVDDSLRLIRSRKITRKRERNVFWSASLLRYMTISSLSITIPFSVFLTWLRVWVSLLNFVVVVAAAAFWLFL